ncbi:MAG: putative NBD/HSP70 family sugar kinase [Halocynthiibacter sp.]|jgi:transcriptional regulator of PTS gene
MIPDQRHHGRSQILGAIRRAGRAARVDLAQETGISQATVTAITADLLREGLIKEVARKDEISTRGRPRVDLSLRGAAHLVAGIKIAARGLSVIVMDFEGQTIAEHLAPLPKECFAPEELLPLVAQALDCALHGAGLERGALSGFGIGLAGLIDTQTGIVRWSPSLTQRDTKFEALLSAHLGLPCFVDNDANLVAMAEMYFGKAREIKDFLVVTIENGVGLGIVLNGALYRGTRGCGAEFGHTKVALNGALCRCGQRGCLEAYVADYALLREATAPDLATLIAHANAGDAAAKDVLARAGQVFAMGLANLVNIFDPALIILSGERMQHDHLYADDVIASIRDQIVQAGGPPPEVQIHKWGDLMWAKGAAAYAISRVSDTALAQISR